MESPLWENRILGHQTQPPNAKGQLIDRRGARADTERIVREYDVRTPSIDITASALSGGNQQKLIVGREMASHPRLLLAAHPTRGVDVGAQAAIWDHLRRARTEGLAVLLICADLDELIGLSDTLKVILRGRLVGRRRPGHRHPRGARLGDDRRRRRSRRSRVMSGLGARFDPRRLGLALVAPLMAFAVALLLSSPVLLIAGHAPLQAFTDMYNFGVKPEQLVNTVNKASGYYLAALAVAIGFRMNLFNIGVDGQYRLAAMVAAVAGAACAAGRSARRCSSSWWRSWWVPSGRGSPGCSRSTAGSAR